MSTKIDHGGNGIMSKFLVQKQDSQREDCWTSVPVSGSGIHARFEHEGDSPEAVLMGLRPSSGYVYRVLALDDAVVIEVDRPPTPDLVLRRVPSVSR